MAEDPEAEHHRVRAADVAYGVIERHLPVNPVVLPEVDAHAAAAGIAIERASAASASQRCLENARRPIDEGCGSKSSRPFFKAFH